MQPASPIWVTIKCLSLPAVWHVSSVQSLSRVQLFVTPWTAARQGLPVHHQLLEFTQTHVHWVGDAIQASYRLSSPSPPALNLSQHEGLFKWMSFSHQVAKILGVSDLTSVLQGCILSGMWQSNKKWTVAIQKRILSRTWPMLVT